MIHGTIDTNTSLINGNKGKNLFQNDDAVVNMHKFTSLDALYEALQLGRWRQRAEMRWKLLTVVSLRYHLHTIFWYSGHVSRLENSTGLNLLESFKKLFACQGGKSSFHQPLWFDYSEYMRPRPGTNSRYKGSDREDFMQVNYMIPHTIISGFIFSAGEQTTLTWSPRSWRQVNNISAQRRTRRAWS